MIVDIDLRIRTFILTSMIPVARPDVGLKELERIRQTLESGWIGLGPKVNEFETRFGATFGHEHVIATNSGTSALDLALKSCELDGTEVLVPPITWISTAFVVWYNELDIGWVDVEPDTLNMSPDSLRDRITDETAAVIPVHYGGQPAEIETIAEIAHEHGAIVIEDCAHAVGTEIEDKPTGSVGDVGCFSFQATKPLTTGEGGAVVTQNKVVAERVRRLSKLGVDKSTHERSEEAGYSWYYRVTDVGYKSFMNDIAAGIGLVQLERLSQTRARRNQVAAAYNDALGQVEWALPLLEKEHATHARYNYTIRVPKDHRDAIIEHLAEHEVGASVHYMPLYKHPVFEGPEPWLPTTERVWKQILTLPMSSTFSDEEVAKVVDAVRSYGDGRSIGEPTLTEADRGRRAG